MSSNDESTGNGTAGGNAMGDNPEPFTVQMPRREPDDYWFITGEWVEMSAPPQSTIQLLGAGPVRPSQAPATRRVVRNEVIDMHPMFYALLAQQTRLKYVVTMAVKVTKPRFDRFQRLMADVVRMREAEMRERLDGAMAKASGADSGEGKVN